jgi:hypothetical protein
MVEPHPSAVAGFNPANDVYPPHSTLLLITLYLGVHGAFIVWMEFVIAIIREGNTRVACYWITRM